MSVKKRIALVVGFLIIGIVLLITRYMGVIADDIFNYLILGLIVIATGTGIYATKAEKL